jgi:Flp pilus assembly pilin Flp
VKITGIEKTVIAIIAVLLVAMVFGVMMVGRDLDSAFGQCAGLKDAVSQVWDGVKCVPR